MTTRHEPDGLPVLYTPEEVAARLGRSGWWVREQCRRGRFPHTRAAGAVRFTRQQFEELLQILERRPEPAPQTPSTSVRRTSKKSPTRAPVTQLRARPPRSPKPVASNDVTKRTA